MRVILFDFDGVIVDTFSFCYRIIQSRDAISEEEYRARFEGNINAAPKKQSSSSEPSKPFDFFGQYTPELMACQPNKDILDVVRVLATNYPLMIISSTISSSIERYLEVIGIRELFQEVLGNDVEKSKVKKIQDVLQRHKVAPSDAVFITDTLGDIKEANACDVRSIGVTWGYHPRETLAQGNPYAIVNQPMKILEVIDGMC